VIGPSGGVELLEGAGLEPFISDDQSVPLPEEDLEAIAATVEEEIGTNAKNLRGRTRDIWDRMSDTGRPRQSARLLAHAATQRIKPHATSTTNHRLS
jgi:hypothetical protein